jgi:hypothetical protein
VLSVGHAGKRREGLALAARAEDHDLLVGELLEVVGVDDVLVGNAQVAKLTGNLGVGDHGAARHHDLAPNRHGGVADLLQAVDMARERRHEDATRSVLDDMAQRGANGRLGRREAGTRGIGGVGEQDVDTLGSEAVDGSVVGTHAIDGGLVKLEVAGVHNVARRRVHEDAKRGRDGVRHGKERDVEGAQGDGRAVLDLAELGALDVVLGKLALDDAQG